MKFSFIFIIILPFFLFAQTDSLKNKKKVDFAFIPVISYNRSFGMQFGALVNGYFDINNEDKISPPSMFGSFGNVFSNKTYFIGLFNRLYFKEDHWRTKTALGIGDIKFQTYIDLPSGIPAVWAEDDAGKFIDYSTSITFLYGEALRLLGNHFYLGLRAVYSSSKTDFESDLKPDETIKLAGVGLGAEYDTRDNVINPHKGLHLRLRTFSFPESISSTETYHNVMFELNKYFMLHGEDKVLLFRMMADVSFGEQVPFVGQNVVGRDDLRGYTDGKYRANQVYDIQSEYRWNFYKRWGMTVFAGLAAAADDLSGANYSGLLPAVGTGLRYKFIEKRDVNIGIDIAAAKNDWGLYFRIGEAFTR